MSTTPAGMTMERLIADLREVAKSLGQRNGEWVEHMMVAPADNEGLDAAELMTRAADELASRSFTPADESSIIREALVDVPAVDLSAKPGSYLATNPGSFCVGAALTPAGDGEPDEKLLAHMTPQPSQTDPQYSHWQMVEYGKRVWKVARTTLPCEQAPAGDGELREILATELLNRHGDDVNMTNCIAYLTDNDSGAASRHDKRKLDAALAAMRRVTRATPPASGAMTDEAAVAILNAAQEQTDHIAMDDVGGFPYWMVQAVKRGLTQSTPAPLDIPVVEGVEHAMRCWANYHKSPPGAGTNAREGWAEDLLAYLDGKKPERIMEAIEFYRVNPLPSAAGSGEKK